MKLLILSLLFTSSAFAAKKLECPQAIFVTPKEDIVTGSPEMPEGWNPRTESVRRELTSASLYDGRPEEKASLVPDKQASQGTKAIWNLSKENKNGYWLECRYAQSVTVISKRVPDEALRCVWSGNKKEEAVFCD